METGKVTIYCGAGKGKTTAAIGQAVCAASRGKSVIIIQFLKGKNENEIGIIKKLEPEIKLFRFEKSLELFEVLSEEQKVEERMNIMNGLNFAKKVLVTGECNVLILDEILGLLDQKIINMDDIHKLLSAKDEETEVIFTGRVLAEELVELADDVYCIQGLKEKK